MTDRIVRIPARYSPELAARICERVREGWSERRLEEEKIVSRKALHSWRREHPDFDQEFRTAREEAISRGRRQAQGPGMRPYDPERARVIAEALSQGCSRSAAAAIGGIHDETLQKWLDAQPEFVMQVHSAEAECQSNMLRLVQQAAEGYQAGEKTYAGQWQAAAWLLERRWGETYALKREVSQADRAKMAGKIGEQLADVLLETLGELDMTPAQQDRLRKTLAERLESVAQAG